MKINEALNICMLEGQLPTFLEDWNSPETTEYVSQILRENAEISKAEGTSAVRTIVQLLILFMQAGYVMGQDSCQPKP